MKFKSLSIVEQTPDKLVFEHDEQTKSVLFFILFVSIGLVLSILSYIPYREIEQSIALMSVLTILGLFGLLFAKKTIYTVDKTSHTIIIFKKSLLRNDEVVIDLHLLQTIQLVTFIIKNLLHPRGRHVLGGYAVFLQYNHKHILLFRESDHSNTFYICNELGYFLQIPVEEIEKNEWFISSKWNYFSP